MEHDVGVEYHGYWIQPHTWSIGDGGFGEKVLIRSAGNQAGVTRLVMLPERWDSFEDAHRHAIEVGKRLIDSDFA